MNLDGVPTEELRAELSRRDEEARRKAWEEINERYGPCPECGSRLLGGEGKVVQEHRSAPNWHAWPLPPPPGYGQLDGVDWETTLICERGHRLVKRETRFYDEPIKDMFG